MKAGNLVSELSDGRANIAVRWGIAVRRRGTDVCGRHACHGSAAGSVLDSELIDIPCYKV